MSSARGPYDVGTANRCVRGQLANRSNRMATRVGVATLPQKNTQYITRSPSYGT